MLLRQRAAAIAPAEPMNMRFIAQCAPKRRREAVEPNAVTESRNEEKGLFCHMESSTFHCTPRPLRREPNYMKQTRDVAKLVGSVPKAVSEKFRRARLTVDVIGDTSAWSDRDKGLLFVGDHRIGVEFAPLLALYGEYNRDLVHFLAKPFSRNARIMTALGQEAVALSVIPRTLARDRANIFNSDLAWRLAEWKRLPNSKDLVRLNAQTLSQAVRYLHERHVVTLYPVGRIADAATHRWQRGVGTIIARLPPTEWEHVHVVVFRFDAFSPSRITRSLTLQSHGITPAPYKMSLRIGVQGSVRELLSSLPSVEDPNPELITAKLRRCYLDAFRGTAF